MFISILIRWGGGAELGNFIIRLNGTSLEPKTLRRVFSQTTLLLLNSFAVKMRVGSLGKCFQLRELSFIDLLAQTRGCS